MIDVESIEPARAFDEADFRRSQLEQNLAHVRVYLCIGIGVSVGFSAIEGLLLGPTLGRTPGMIRVLLMVPALLAALAASFSVDRQRLNPPVSTAAAAVLCGGIVVIHTLASRAGVTMLFPAMLLAATFTYFLMGLDFARALSVNVAAAFAFLVAGTSLALPGREFGYDAVVLAAFNLFCASVLFRQEKIARARFLEAGRLRDMVARDGLTGIRNRRTFDEFLSLAWQQSVRESRPMAVLLVDIDCFKDFNDRYGHQAGDECLRAVAVSLARCARRSLDCVARYGGEEFALVLCDASRESMAEVCTRIQRSIAELNIAHDASPVASRLTVSIGAALILPAPQRTPEGLVQLADEALYAAKEQGRNRVVALENEYHGLKTGRFQKRRARSPAYSEP